MSSSWDKQPTPEREAANAAYVWRVQCQADLVNEANDRNKEFERVAWYFERYRIAKEREVELEELAKASEATKN